MPRLYWLKLKTDFFDEKEVKKLRSIAGGDTYTIIYLKMLLLSLPEDGFIAYDGVEATPSDELALQINEKKDDVSIAIGILKQLNLITEVKDGSYHVERFQELVGSETDAAARKRKSRRKQALLQIGQEKSLQCNADVISCNTDKDIDKDIDKDVTLSQHCHNIVTKCYSDVTKCHTDIDIDIDTDIDTDKIHCRERQCLSDEVAPYKVVIERLNELTGSHFRDSTQSTRRLIKARLAEGFTVADLITVVEKMVSAWKGTEMAQYLRPSTLFNASKFEGYLNRKEVQAVDDRIRAVQEAYESGEDVDTSDIPY